MNKVVELYSEAELARMQGKVNIGKKLLIGVAALTLAACLFQLFTATTATAARNEWIAILISVVGGWIGLFLLTAVVVPEQRETAHAKMILSEPRDAVTGTVEVTNQKVKILKSVTIYKVRVTVSDEEEPQIYNISVEKAAQLKAAGPRLTLYTVHSYIAAYEVAA